MKDIKELIKKAKKEEKKNPEFLYQLGLCFKNGDNCEQSDKKAEKYCTVDTIDLGRKLKSGEVVPMCVDAPKTAMERIFG